MKQSIFVIILLAALAGTGFFVYRFFTSGMPTGAEVVGISDISAEKLSEYRKIKTLKLDLGIFADRFFTRSLFNPSQVFRAPEASQATGVNPGRTNPFVPF